MSGCALSGQQRLPAVQASAWVSARRAEIVSVALQQMPRFCSWSKQVQRSTEHPLSKLSEDQPCSPENCGGQLASLRCTAHIDRRERIPSKGIACPALAPTLRKNYPPPPPPPGPCHVNFASKVRRTTVCRALQEKDRESRSSIAQTLLIHRSNTSCTRLEKHSDAAIWPLRGRAWGGACHVFAERTSFA